MMKKLLGFLLTLLTCLTMLAGCVAPVEIVYMEESGEDDSGLPHNEYAQVSTADFNKGLYYINSGGVDIADPTMIYITDEESTEYGYFYAYGTSYSNGYRCLRSKNLTNWEDMGKAFSPKFDETWASYHYWAPEVIYDQGKYYLLYSARRVRGALGSLLYMSVAVADEPYGPFKEPTHVNLDGRQLSPSEPVYNDFRILPNRRSQANTVLDIQPFIDPQTGDRYIYFSAAFQGGSIPNGYQEIYGCKMKDWFTPDYSTVKQLTSVFCTTVRDNYNEMQKGYINFTGSDIQEGQDEDVAINEGPFMYYKDGTYYLTFSVYGYTEWQYQVRQAISDAPLGDFTKIQPSEGGTVIASEGNWQGHVMSAGHHSFFTVGDELMIAYHTYYNRKDTAAGRMLAVDKIVMNEINGKKLLHANGPSYSYQPLPEVVSGYKNVASQASVSVTTNGQKAQDVSALTNDIIKTHPNTHEKEFVAKKGNTEIVLDFGDQFVNARSIMVYNGYDYQSAFTNVDRITLQYYVGNGATKEVTVKNIAFDHDWHSNAEQGIMYPLGAAIMEFAELPVNKITLLISEQKPFAISEIYVLGQETSEPVAVEEFKDCRYWNPIISGNRSRFQGEVFGSVANKNSTIGWGRFWEDDGTENAYIENDMNGTQRAYVRGINTTNFYFETEITVTASAAYLDSNGKMDKAPKCGIVLGRTFYYLNADYDRSEGRFVGSSVGVATDSNWETAFTYAHSQAYTNGAYVKLAVARVGKEFYFYFNDELILKRSDLPEYSERTAGIINITTWNIGVRLRNYSYTVDKAEVQAKIAALV